MDGQLRDLATPERCGTRRQVEGESRRSRSRSRRSRSRSRSSRRRRHRRGRSRSHSQSSSRSMRGRRSRSRLSLREQERELERERLRLNALEDRVRRRRSELREYSNAREDTRLNEPPKQMVDPQCSKVPAGEHAGPQEENTSGVNISTQQKTTKGTESVSVNDVVNILNLLRHETQPSTAPHTHNINNKNILPDFDPSTKNQRIDTWLKKVNECATVYGWDDKTVIHFAMQKLQGLAKMWYESQNTILFTWSEWQKKLLDAFPCEQNYGQSLEEMLKRKSRLGEPIEVYFYEKLALLNQCEIEGKRAVDCIIHGLTDKTTKSSALTLRCSQPDQLLQFLMSNKESPSLYTNERTNYRSRVNIESNIKTSGFRPNNRQNNFQREPVCFNCKEKGHPYMKCPKPLIKCLQCHRFGHTVESCKLTPPQNNSVVNGSQKTMCISSSNPNSKYLKDVTINGVDSKAFVDFGSEASLIMESFALKLGLDSDRVGIPLKGFGNNIICSKGKVTAELVIDDVSATVSLQVIQDDLLETPLLVGQSFTEQKHVVVYKNSEQLHFLSTGDDAILPNVESEQTFTVKVLSSMFVELHGPGTVFAKTEVPMNGLILVTGRIVGKPNHQFAIHGGIYQVTNGNVRLTVTPSSKICRIHQNAILSRATNVQIINRISTPLREPLEVTDRDNLGQIKVASNVSEEHVQRLHVLLDKYKHCFASSLKDLGCTTAAEMSIEVNSNKPIVYRPYRLSHKEREDVRVMVGEMQEAGIIRESVSDYASPIILVRKRDGKLRMCIDYRQLNSVTTKEHYPMPVIDDEISRLSGQAYFVTLDLASGYYQVPISEESKHLTSFVTPDGQYEFNRMPFGLANAPAVFQRMMNRVLGSARYTKATAYLDDILIYGKTIDECLERLEDVLRLLDNANLTLNLSKCEFLLDKIDYLGYEISSAGIRPGDRKIQSVADFPVPTNIHSVRQFLGLVGYFRKFILNFAQIAHPLTRLLKKDAKWSWSVAEESAFQTLKQKLTSRPILAIYDPEAETELHTDASKVGVGGILMQKAQNSNSFKPVAYYSRQTSPEEKNFHAYELETLAVVGSLKKFRVYLLGKAFKIVTDCSALRSTFSKRDIIPRIARWWLLLQEFNCNVEYRSGSKMAHVDALSRNPVTTDSPSSSSCNISDDCFPCVMSITSGSDDWLHTLQLGDSELRRIRDILSSNMDADGLKYIKDNYIIKDNKLYRILDGDASNIRWVVPKGARWQICRLNHDDLGHFGIEKTLERIKSSYWFPNMSKFVKKYVGACLECAYAKKSVNNKEGQLHPIEKVDIPFHTVHIDHLGPFVRSKRGNSYLLVVVDSFTKFALVKPVKNTKTETAIRILNDIFYTFRVPDRLISDRGSCFTSHAFKRYCTEKGLKHILNAVASPRSNGQVERYNRTILDSLKALGLNSNEKNWDDDVGKVQWGLNNTRQKTTGRTPSEVMFGTSMNVEIDPRFNELRQETGENTDIDIIRTEVKDRLDHEQEKQKINYDKGRRPARLYSEGDLIKLTKTTFNNDGKSKKLLPSYVGPYRVVEILGNDRYRIAAIPGLSSCKGNRKSTVAADRMLPWVHVAALDVNESSDESRESDNNSCAE